MLPRRYQRHREEAYERQVSVCVCVTYISSDICNGIIGDHPSLEKIKRLLSREENLVVMENDFENLSDIEVDLDSEDALLPTDSSAAAAPRRWRTAVFIVAMLTLCGTLLYSVNVAWRRATFRHERDTLFASMTRIRERNAAAYASGAAATSSRSGNATFAIVGSYANPDGHRTACAVGAVVENHRRYAAAHGYAFYNVPEIVRNPGVSFLTDAHFFKLHLVREKLREHAWVLWVDFDAIFVDLAVRLEDLVDSLPSPKPSFVFSGDSNILNDGVILVRKSKWSERLLSDALAFGREPEFDGANVIGMTGDNAALAILFGGCSPSSTQAEREACYDRVDVGWTDASVAQGIRDGDVAVADRLIAPSVRPHVHLVAQSRFQGEFLLCLPLRFLRILLTH